MRKLKTASIILLMGLNIFYQFGEANEEMVTLMYRLNNVPAHEVAKSLEEMYSESQIKPRVSLDKRTNSLIITASPDAQQQVKAMIDKLDEKRRQVVVIAKVIEITVKEVGDLGIDWGAGGTFHDKWAPGAIEEKLLELMGKSKKVDIISAPLITVLDREEGTIDMIQDVPYMEPVQAVFYRLKRKTKFVPVEYKLFVRRSLNRSEWPGIRFAVKPLILENEQIQMDINLRIDMVRGHLPFPEAPKLQLGKPLINKREISTSITVKNGDTVVLGELITQGTTSTTEGESKEKRVIFYLVQPQILDKP